MLARTLAVGAALVLLALAPVAHATTTIVVTTASDTVANDGRCSLREALTAANTDTASGLKNGECPAGSGADIVRLRKLTTYPLRIVGADEDANASGDLDVTANVQIRGGRGTVIAQHTFDRVIDVLSGGVLTLFRLKIVGGRAPIDTIGGNGERGGGIRNAATLFVVRAAVVGNAAGNGSVVDPGVVIAGGGGSGGGIFNSGTLAVDSSLVASNRAGDGADLSNGTTATTSGGSGGAGGGIANLGALTVTSSRIVGNVAGAGGNGATAANSSVLAGGSGGPGGGILSSGGSLTVTLSKITQNVGGRGARGGASDVPAGAGGQGGFGGTGGGIANGTANGTIDRSTIAGNVSGAGGMGGKGGSGGVGGSGGNAGDGGGLIASATTTILASTFASNIAGSGAGGGPPGSQPGGTKGARGSAGDGGAVSNVGALIVRNSTFSGNAAAGSGGAIDGGANATLNNVTVASNRADTDDTGGGDGGGLRRATGSFTVTNSIVALNSVGSSGVGPDCAGTFGGDFDLVFRVTGCTGLPGANGLSGVNPKLATLDRFGGPTKTRALRRGSPAINHGNPAAPGSGGGACELTDQRGINRGTLCDIGAFERNRS